ncbi:MAG: hypothetical protein ACFB22_12995 [Rhodothalassiaceae bacterium]
MKKVPTTPAASNRSAIAAVVSGFGLSSMVTATRRAWPGAKYQTVRCDPGRQRSSARSL